MDLSFYVIVTIMIILFFYISRDVVSWYKKRGRKQQYAQARLEVEAKLNKLLTNRGDATTTKTSSVGFSIPNARTVPAHNRRDYVFNLLSSTIVLDGEELLPLRDYDYDEERISSMCDFFEEHYEDGVHYTVSFDPNSLVGRVHKRFLQQLSVVADVYGFIEADRVPNFNNKCGYLINFYRKEETL